MVGPAGYDSPSPIGPLLIWQQPHPIYLAELCYRAHPSPGTLEIYRDIVLETAEFMASYVQYDETNNRYVLGPPVIPAQENHRPETTLNPTFELEYWCFGLNTANQWRKRLGLDENETWREIASRLSALPVMDGFYLAHENCPATFSRFNLYHPSMLGALGVLPGMKVDRGTMMKTLYKVLQEWRLEEMWGWDFPMIAMTRAGKVARLLEQAYGDIDMADLAIPFFAVSSNLTTGGIEVHRRGLLRRAMRNLHAALAEKVARSDNDELMHKIAALLDEATQKIERS